MKKPNQFFWESITWIVIIVLTIYVILAFPWYKAQEILQYIMIALGVAAVVWYLKSRRLVIETEKKSQDILAKKREIERQHKTIDLIFNNSTDGILIIDTDQKIVNFSPGMEKITGFNKNDVIGLPAQSTLKFSGNADNSLLPDLVFMPPNINKKPIVKNSMVTKEGRAISIEASYSSIKGNGNVNYGLAIIRDVTYEEELVRRDKEFIALTSHQLNTPLSIVRGYLSLLKSGKVGPINQQQNKYLDTIHQSIVKTISLTNNLLSISRIEQDKVKLEKVDLNLSDFFDKIKSEYEAIATDKNVILELLPVDNNLIIYADEDKLDQAIGNLVDNAIKYSNKGKVTLKAESNSDSVTISVSDAGMGIDPDELDKIGQKFYRSQDAINIDNKGTGLGVFIAKTIVEKHDGTISIKSTKGKGTTFIITLPKS